MKMELTRQQEEAIKGEAGRKINDIAGLWLRWNIKMISGDELASQIQKLLPQETKGVWRDYIKPLSADDPLRALFV